MLMSGGTAAYAFLSGTMLRRRECFLVLCDLAGWRAQHLWHGKGSSRDGYPDEELFAVLEDRRQGWDDYDGDDAEAVDAMIKRSPAAADDELAQRYTGLFGRVLCDLARAHCVERRRARCCQAHGTAASLAQPELGSYRWRRCETPPVGCRFRRGARPISALDGRKAPSVLTPVHGLLLRD